MSVAIEGQVGPRLLGDGTPHVIRTCGTGEMGSSDVHARYLEAVARGNVYIGANLGGTSVTTQAGLSATTPALTLYNPVGSGVNLSLLTITVGVTASPAAACAIMLAYNAVGATAPATVTTATVANANLGIAATGKAVCHRIATLAAAPVMIRMIWGATGASAISGTPYVDHVDGEIVIAPGVAVSIQTTSAAAVLASFTWEEVPLRSSQG